MGAKITFLPAGTSDSEMSRNPVLAVPAAAVANRNNRQVVFQVKDDRAVEIPVVLGQRLGNLVEIKQGLKEGDKVVGKLDETISAGSRVTVKK
jgi:HlyD family secretion protein